MPDTNPRPVLHRLRGRPGAALAAVALLAAGGAVGAVAIEATRPSVTMASAVPVAIRSLGTDGIVTIRGRIVEIYGNKFIMADTTGRALVDTGREGERGLVTAGEPVLVQGRFEHGSVRAAFLVGPDSKVVALGPVDGPHRDPGRHGPRPGGDDGFGPPPPPSAGPGPRPGADAPTPAAAAVSVKAAAPVAGVAPSAD